MRGDTAPYYVWRRPDGYVGWYFEKFDAHRYSGDYTERTEEDRREQR